LGKNNYIIENQVNSSTIGSRIRMILPLYEL
jgi:hypothetical protein